MTLTKEDLTEIGKLLDEKLEQKLNEKLDKKLDEKLEPFRKAVTQVLHAQVELVDKIELLETNVKLIMFHLNLSPRSRELRKTLQEMERITGEV